MRVALAFFACFLLLGAAGDDGVEPAGLRLSSCGGSAQLPPVPPPREIDDDDQDPRVSFTGTLDFGDDSTLDDDDVASDDDDTDGDDDSTPNDDDDDVDPDDDDVDDDTTSPPVDADGDGWTVDEDCDEADPAVHPEATEACDELDTDCDGSVVDGFTDLDGDDEPDCTDNDDDGDGFSGSVNDCDDLDGTVWPGAAEVCDGVDSDCDGDVVEGFGDLDGDLVPDCADADADGDGVSGVGGDCDDLDADVFPGQTAWFTVERAGGGWDYDCDGVEEPELTLIAQDLGPWTGAVLPAPYSVSCWTEGWVCADAVFMGTCDDMPAWALPSCGEAARYISAWDTGLEPECPANAAGVAFNTGGPPPESEPYTSQTAVRTQGCY